MQRVELSVVVTIVGGGEYLERCLQSLVAQVSQSTPGRVEILVPFDSTVQGIEALKQKFPEFQFLNMGAVETAAPGGSQAAEHELYDCRSAFGVVESRGEIVALLQDYVVVSENWSREVLKAHELGHAAVGGAVEHGGQSILNWAVFFQDFGRHQLPLSEGPAEYLTDINVSYRKSKLEPFRELWEKRYKETTVNFELAKRGEVLWQRPQILVYQSRGKLAIRELISERYHWGRLFGAIRTQQISTIRRLIYTILAPAIPVFLLFRAARKVILGRKYVSIFLRSLPFFTLLVGVWCWGELVGNITGKDSFE